MHRKAHKRLILFAFPCLLLLCSQKTGAQTDSLYYELDSTTFAIQRHSSPIRTVSPHAMDISMDRIQALPKIMGNTDPVSFIKNLPGVQTGTEYDSGIHIQGCDNAHNDISLAGVPIYGANHLFGFFSIFNPAHYSRMRFSRTAEGNRLGGALQMELPDTLKDEVTGEIAAGIMSSQGTLGIRVGGKSHLRVSARQSYMNLLYKRWLLIEGSPIRYGFGDYNISWLHEASDKDRIWVEGYFGQDRTMIAEQRFNIDLTAQWGNYSGAVHWERRGKEVTQRHTFFTSGYISDGHMTQNESVLNLTSHINTTGYKGHVTWRGFRWNAGVCMHDIQPQTPETEGLYGVEAEGGPERQLALETSVSAGYRKTFADRWSVDAGVGGTFYLSPERQYDISVSPNISISYNAYHLGRLTASCGMRHQYLFQAGLSNIGLPVEFWFAAGRYSMPQYSVQSDLSYEAGLFHDAVMVSVDAYFKRLYNQVEYKGDILDFFNSRYSLDNHLLKGDGWNYGLNMMIHKQTGKLTGWVSYSLGRALRRFDNRGYSGIYPANHERIHELNAVCAYETGRWNFSGTFVYADGAPFTAPEHYYISAGQIVSKPGRHNACRMRPYIRTDLSVTFSITRNERQENGINVSMYNVTGQRNDVMYRLKAQNGTYSYGNMTFFLRWVPSISYFHKF